MLMPIVSYMYYSTHVLSEVCVFTLLSAQFHVQTKLWTRGDVESVKTRNNQQYDRHVEYWQTLVMMATHAGLPEGAHAHFHVPLTE